MNITELIKHPEQLNKETLYDLRSLIALYPFYQTARLLMLQNLYLLHDPTFDEELRRAAAYITDRRVIFNLVEANHYKPKRPQVQIPEGNRTVSRIDNFLSSIPADAEETENEKTEEAEYQMTEWLKRKGACGPTGYPHSYLNIQWCRAEVERLRSESSSK